MTFSQITIVRARTPEHIEVARGLFREYAAWLGVDLCFQSFDRELAELPGDYAPPSGELLLACSEKGDYLGCAALHGWHGEPGIAEMKRLYVAPAARGQGFGNLLISAIITEARQRGYQRLRLDSIADKMPAALRLYRRFGFQEIPPYRHNPLPAAVFLELDLTAEDLDQRLFGRESVPL